jgi:hypothetical protein
MSVLAALNNATETQDKDMDDNLGNVIDAFAESPLREGKLPSINIKYKWMGENSDHCGDQKRRTCH